jgi:hypothetical protein
MGIIVLSFVVLKNKGRACSKIKKLAFLGASFFCGEISFLEAVTN